MTNSGLTQNLRLALRAQNEKDLRKALSGFSVAEIQWLGDSLFLSVKDSTNSSRLKPLLLQHFQSKGYLLASLDSLNQLENRESALLFLGPPIQWLQLRPSPNIPKDWLKSAHFRLKSYQKAPFEYTALLVLEQKLLEQAEEHGYPFASVRLDSIGIDSGGSVSALLELDKNRLFHFSDVRIQGDLKLPPRFLGNYLGIQPGMMYSRAKVLRIRDQLRSLPYLELTGNPGLSFAGSEALVKVYAKKKRSGRFDFIIGLLPRPNDDAGRLLLTGSLDAAFQNALNQGERFALSLERLRPETQKMNLEAAIPYLLGTSFGAEGKLNIFRRDSSWVDAQSDLGAQYLFGGNNFLRIFWENKSSTLQKFDSVSIIRDRKLPSNLDYRQNGFGLELDLNRLDYLFNPRKGWQLRLKGVAGLNKILRNNQIEALSDPADPAFNFTSLYDQLPQEKAARYRLETNISVFLPLLQRSTIKISLQSGSIFSSAPAYLNELYRLGGNKRLRGFDEESLLSTRFAISTLEYRLLLGQNAYLSAFGDYGYVENISANTRLFFRPLGLGAGLNIETAAGIFGISAAVGRQNPGLGIDFRAAKFHIGYVSLF